LDCEGANSIVFGNDGQGQFGTGFWQERIIEAHGLCSYIQRDSGHAVDNCPTDHGGAANFQTMAVRDHLAPSFSCSSF